MKKVVIGKISKKNAFNFMTYCPRRVLVKFGFLTIANELIWRNYSTEEWVFVKVFILFQLVGIFMLAQLPLTLRGRIKKD